MGEERIEKRLEKLEQRLRVIEAKLESISADEKRLHNIVLRLAATSMAISEIMQKRRMIEIRQFEEQVRKNIKTLDQEISQKKTSRYLEDIWKKFDEHNE